MNSQPSQHWQADVYADNARFVADYGVPLLDILAPRPHERVLDLGCGDGVLTQKIAELGCEVIGIDGSEQLVAAARANGIDARVGDGQKLAFNQEFDAVFSNAALHWMMQAEAVVAGVAAALKPGGRFVAEAGGQGNIAVIQQALEQALAKQHLQARAYWYFPSAETYRRLLEQHGFEVLQIGLYPRPTVLPTGVAGWLATFAEPMLPQMDAATKQAVLEAAADEAERQLPQENGLPVADYVRLRFVAVKK